MPKPNTHTDPHPFPDPRFDTDSFPDTDSVSYADRNPYTGAFAHTHSFSHAHTGPYAHTHRTRDDPSTDRHRIGGSMDKIKEPNFWVRKIKKLGKKDKDLAKEITKK